MSKGPSAPPIGDSILEDATAWFIDLNEGELDAEGRERLNQWLRRSPEHVRAYLEIAAAWADASRLNQRQPIDHAALVAAALAESNIVPLPRRPSDSGRTAPVARGLKRAGLVGIAASAMIVAAGWLYYSNAVRNTFSTATGEQRSIVLADGSTMELNSRSRVRVLFSKGERTVALIEGQALFQVRQQPSRPFVVVSNGTRVRAVGTTFDVYYKTVGTVVTVIEGRVAVTPPPSSAHATTHSSQLGVRAEPTQQAPVAPDTPILLSAGEQLTVTAQAASPPIPTNVDAATAWTQRKLVFEETPLREAVAEFNRYNIRQIVIDDPQLAGYHIRGSFESRDPDRLIQFLRERFGAGVTDNGTETRISRKQNIEAR